MLHTKSEAKANLKRDLKKLRKTTNPLKRNFLITSIECWKIALEA